MKQGTFIAIKFFFLFLSISWAFGFLSQNYISESEGKLLQIGAIVSMIGLGYLVLRNWELNWRLKQVEEKLIFCPSLGKLGMTIHLISVVKEKLGKGKFKDLDVYFNQVIENLITFKFNKEISVILHNQIDEYIQELKLVVLSLASEEKLPPNSTESDVEELIDGLTILLDKIRLRIVDSSQTLI